MIDLFFIGIGGIGMSALARYYNKMGMRVSGYDRSQSELTVELEREGIIIYYKEDPSLLPRDVDKTIVIYSKAIPDDSLLLKTAREKGYTVLSRARVLGEITLEGNCIAVSGTHGKSTVTAMIAHILKESGKDCSAFIGAMSKNSGGNLMRGSSDNIVVEADEYGRSFLELHPDIAVITGEDTDHLDVYGDVSGIEEAFRKFAGQVSDILIVKEGAPVSAEDTRARILTYHVFGKNADFCAKKLCSSRSGYYLFDIKYPGGIIHDIRPGVPGLLNVENSIAATAVALNCGVSPAEIRDAIHSFKGLRRRLDVLVDTADVAYIDDFAHHPTEILSSLFSIRTMFPERKVTVVFQPHLYSRTRNLAKEFARALSGADNLILLDIYPAREDPLPGVSSEMLLKDVKCLEKEIVKKDDLLDYLAKKDIDVLVTMGAGDIGGLVKPITDIILEKHKDMNN